MRITGKIEAPDVVREGYNLESVAAVHENRMYRIFTILNYDTWEFLAAPQYLAVYDVETAIRALDLLRRQLPDARLTIAGAGPELDKLQRAVASLRLGDAVHFAGRMVNAAVAELYRSADAMLNPSLVDNMPISVLEAFASGVPVVSTNVGGVPFIAEHERNALLVPPSDPAACAAALGRVLQDAALADRLRRAALDDAAAYSCTRVRELWLAEYRRVQSQERAT